PRSIPTTAPVPAVIFSAGGVLKQTCQRPFLRVTRALVAFWMSAQRRNGPKNGLAAREHGASVGGGSGTWLSEELMLRL
ncbi:MAG: hypothetical protein WCG47_12245, partial [Dermatophilaceae bacterium]